MELPISTMMILEKMDGITISGQVSFLHGPFNINLSQLLSIKKNYKMKKLIIILSLVLYNLGLNAQEFQTIFSSDKSEANNYTVYGGPLVNSTIINNEWSALLGGKGGILVNNKISLGIVGMGLFGEHEYSNEALSENDLLSLHYGSGGFFVEYFLNISKALNISFPINVLMGGVSVKDSNTNAELESGYVFVVEPGMNLNFKLKDGIMPAINISYRWAYADDMISLNNDDFSGLSVGLVFKFCDF